MLLPKKFTFLAAVLGIFVTNFIFWVQSVCSYFGCFIFSIARVWTLGLCVHANPILIKPCFSEFLFLHVSTEKAWQSVEMWTSNAAKNRLKFVHCALNFLFLIILGNFEANQGEKPGHRRRDGSCRGRGQIASVDQPAVIAYHEAYIGICQVGFNGIQKTDLMIKTFLMWIIAS